MAHPAADIPAAPLSDVLSLHGPLPARAVCELIAAVAAALVAEHSVGLAHQNIRLTTIHLSADGEVWLTDSPGTDPARDLHDLGTIGLDCLDRLDGLSGRAVPELLPRLLRAMTDAEADRRPSIERVAQWAAYIAQDAPGSSLSACARRSLAPVRSSRLTHWTAMASGAVLSALGGLSHI
jgi:hypothetical protein